MANQLNITSSNPLPISLGGTANSVGASTLSATTSTSSNATFYPLFVASSSNSNQVCNLGTGLTFNPSTNILTTTEYNGNIISLGATASAITGTTPVVNFSSNYSDGTYFAFGSNASIGITSTGRLYLARNLYLDGSTGLYKYIADGFAYALELQGGGIALLAAGSGTAGNTASPTAVLSATNSAATVTGSLTVSNGSSACLLTDNVSPYQAKNSTGTYETWVYPRYNDNVMYLQYGSAGLSIRNNSASVALFATNGLDIQVSAGNLVIQTATKGLQLKSTAVSAGTANALMVTGCVLVSGTVTINNSSVTTSHKGIPMLQTSGGTLGAWSVVCGSGTFTINSTNVLDTSTISVLFVLPN